MWRDDDGGGCTDDVELMDLGDPGGSSVVDESDSEDDGVDGGVGTTYSSTSRRTVPFSLVAPLYAVAFLQAAAILMALSLLFPVTSKKLCSVNATWNSTTNECTDAITEAVSTDEKTLVRMESKGYKVADEVGAYFHTPTSPFCYSFV